MRRTVEGYLKCEKNAVWDLAPPTLQNSGIFHDSSRLTFTLTVCRRNRSDRIRRLYIRLRVCYKFYKKHSLSGLAWSRAHADRGLSLPTNVFRTTIGVCKILSRSIEIWQYEGQKPVFEQKTERPSIVLAVNNRIYIAPCSHNFRGASGRSDRCSVKTRVNKKV